MWCFLLVIVDVGLEVEYVLVCWMVCGWCDVILGRCDEIFLLVVVDLLCV